MHLGSGSQWRREDHTKVMDCLLPCALCVSVSSLGRLGCSSHKNQNCVGALVLVCMPFVAILPVYYCNFGVWLQLVTHFAIILLHCCKMGLWLYLSTLQCYRCLIAILAYGFSYRLCSCREQDAMLPLHHRNSGKDIVSSHV